MKIKPTKKQRSNPTNHEDQTYKETKIKSTKKKQQTQIESMNHEDQTHKEETTNPLRSQQRRNNKGSRKIKPKQQRSNPNHEYQTRKIKPKQ